MSNPHKTPHKTPHITPAMGVTAFIKRLGGSKHTISAATSMGFRLSIRQLKEWKEKNEMPEHYYQALSSLVMNDETQIARGWVEVYYKGEGLGKLYLSRDITLVIKKRRTT